MIKRTVLKTIEDHLKAPEMTVLTGPRQVGKTYLLRLLEESLQKKGEKTVYLNLDYEKDMPRVKTQETLVDYLRLQVGEGKAYVFIDEIQRKKDTEIFLKGLYDMNLPYKFILSGSGSIELKSKIVESLAGRKRFFQIDPLSFEEFVNYRTDYRYEEKLPDFFTVLKSQADALLEEYIAYGGYPRVVLSITNAEKSGVMEDIYSSYVSRDIRDFLDVEKPDAFTALVRIMASQIGSLVNTSELASTIGIADKTIQHYLWYLEKTFIMRKVTPYYRNIRSEIVKAPIYYFYDSGLRNYMLGLFGLPSMKLPLTGHLFENIVFNTLHALIKTSPTKIHFWRTKDNAEVDFVLQVGLEVIPVEVKYTVLKSPETTRSFKSFLTKYKPKDAYIVHIGEYMKESYEDTTIHFLPFYNLQAIFKTLLPLQ